MFFDKDMAKKLFFELTFLLEGFMSNSRGITRIFTKKKAKGNYCFFRENWKFE